MTTDTPPERADDVEETPTVVFSPSSRQRSVVGAMRELYEYRPFVSYLMRRDLKTLYARSYLGWLWSIINPIIVLAIYWFVFGKILQVDRGLESQSGLDSFAHFLMSGLIIWGLFNAGSNRFMSSFSQAVKLRKKLYFPPSAPGVAGSLTQLVEASLELLVLVVFYVVVGNFGPTFLLVPYVMVLGIIYGMGVGMLLAVPNVRFNDVGYLYTLFLRLFFYLTPIIWSYTLIEQRIGVRWIQILAEWNPIAKLIQVNRNITYDLVLPTWGDFLYVNVVGVLIFFVGWRSFHKRAIYATEGL